MKNVTGVAIIGVLSALAVTGWSQKMTQSAPQAAWPAANAQPLVQPAFYTQPGVALPAVSDGAAPAPVFAQAQLGTQPRYQTVSDRRGYERPRYARQPDYSYGRAGRYENRARSGRYDDGYYNDGEYRRDRPGTHSAVIIGGGAAAGAAIGGMAGGGKGAAIGALAGGAAGLVYDRMTHKNARW